MKDVHERAREQRPHSEQKVKGQGRGTTDTRSTGKRRKGDEYERKGRLFIYRFEQSKTEVSKAKTY